MRGWAEVLGFCLRDPESGLGCSGVECSLDAADVCYHDEPPSNHLLT